MKLPTIENRTVTQYRLPGERKWWMLKRSVYIRAALRMIRGKCTSTAAGAFCYSDDPDHHCKWHANDAKYARKVVARLVRMWMRADREDGRCHNLAKRDGLCRKHAPKVDTQRWQGWGVIEGDFLETFSSEKAARARFALRVAGGWPCRLVQVDAVATVRVESKL